VCQAQPPWKSADLGRLELECHKINFESPGEKIGTSSRARRFVFHAFAALAHFERNLIRDTKSLAPNRS
jgi:DNA invertase Pin-like site-specific DNA recombinase